MQQEFWIKRWENGETGFHQDQLNPYLGYFYGVKGPALENRQSLKVFVPLCGKSLDMYWLIHNGYEVLAIECSEIAIKSFFQEHKLDYRVEQGERFTHYVAENTESHRRVELLLGDFFDLTRVQLAGITDVYDRASMIALPENMRSQYADKMADLLEPGMRTLLITLSYDQTVMEGPPFSVSDDEIKQFYQANFNIDKLLGKDIINDEPSFQKRGLSSLYESAYKLTRK